MSETTRKPGKFYIQTTVRDYFDTAEEREHYIKEHMEAPFDTKAELLAKGETEQYDEDEQVLIRVETKEVRE